MRYSGLDVARDGKEKTRQTSHKTNQLSNDRRRIIAATTAKDEAKQEEQQ
jgi:hypothetical protein